MSTSKNPKIVILRSDEPHNEYLTILLRNRFDVRAVVIEPGAAQLRRRRQQRRYRDFVYWTYHGWRRRWLGLSAYRARYFAGAELDPSAPNVERVEVADVNDRRVRELLRRIRPDLTIVICTSILRRATLDAAGTTIINIHGGVLPDYRGNHCFFFAVVNQDFDKIGTTIHFVDAGVDTGDIIEIVRPEIRADDTPETLYCRAGRAAIHRLVELLELYAITGEFPRRPQGSGGRQYYTRDRGPLDDLRYYLRRWTGSLVLPTRSVSTASREPGQASR